MKHYSFSTAWINAVVAATLVYSGVLSAPANGVNPSNSLMVTIASSKHEMFEREPIEICLSVQNISATPKKFFGPPETVTYEIARANGEYRPLLIGGGETQGQPRRYNLDAGKTIVHAPITLVIELPDSSAHKASADPFIFKHEGQYRLRVRYYYYDDSKSECVTSEPVMIVVKPLPDGEEKAEDLWAAASVARAIQSGEKNEVAAKRLTELVEKYPDSIYAPYARKYLGLPEKSAPSTQKPTAP